MAKTRWLYKPLFNLDTVVPKTHQNKIIVLLKHESWKWSAQNLLHATTSNPLKLHPLFFVLLVVPQNENECKQEQKNKKKQPKNRANQP